MTNIQIPTIIDFVGLAPLWMKATEWYSFNKEARGYHNLNHALEVVENIQKLKRNAPSALLLAGMWHDAVYVPQAGLDANERCSAAALLGCYKTHCVPKVDELDKIIEDAGKLIVKTSLKYHLVGHNVNRLPKDEYLEGLDILLDADLASLAAPYDTFIRNQKNIIEENFGTFENDKQKSAAFLKQFLTVRPTIYHSALAQELWEDSARKNILRYSDECGQ